LELATELGARILLKVCQILIIARTDSIMVQYFNLNREMKSCEMSKLVQQASYG